ncbi:hypothetical protein DNL40_03025 [Xylanimonas oleitrophica]|uniref:Uncharacterized protein n=1 Tax=Xylanimonas oleitrophica TaxID=2607479 RepID=A0A2W5X341_9MICO|nr:hypothetical protein [Xylanimonas oleitrophica]PZR55356.1 hypothetical protein DNL40_03025 [Xylanimonas oleitrophica]
MVTFVVWCVVAVLLVAGVFLVANVMERRDDDVPVGLGGSLRGFWSSFRAGLRRERREEAVPEPVDTDLDTFFAGTVESGPAYVDAEQLSDVLHRAREQATRQLHVGTVHRPDVAPEPAAGAPASPAPGPASPGGRG